MSYPVSSGAQCGRMEESGDGFSQALLVTSSVTLGKSQSLSLLASV